MCYYCVLLENIVVKSLSKFYFRRRIGEFVIILVLLNKDEVKWMRFIVYLGDGNEFVFCDLLMMYFYKNLGIYSFFIIVEDV